MYIFTCIYIYIFFFLQELLDEEESDDTKEDQKNFQPLAPSMLIERRYVFHNRLIKIVKEHHTVDEFAHMFLLDTKSFSYSYRNFWLITTPC